MCLCVGMYMHMSALWMSEDLEPMELVFHIVNHPMWMLQADLRFSLPEDSEVLLTTESPLHPCTVS